MQRLLVTHGGYVAVGARALINDQSLYQIANCKPDSKTGKVKSVGPSIRRRLDAAFPGWLDAASAGHAAGTSSAQAVGEAVRAPTLAEALPLVLDALADAPDRAEIKTLLALLMDTGAPAYRQRLAELLARGAAEVAPAAAPAAQQPAPAATAPTPAAPPTLTVAGGDPENYRLRFRRPGEPPDEDAYGAPLAPRKHRT